MSGRRVLVIGDVMTDIAVHMDGEMRSGTDQDRLESTRARLIIRRFQNRIGASTVLLGTGNTQ